jgi:predicted GNAT family N-acyltransferase
MSYVIEVISKKPSECSEVELQDFAAFVRASGEVVVDGLDVRIKKAEALIFLKENSFLKGIAGVKKPKDSYKEDVFKKAQVPDKANEFTFELGYIFVLPSSRGRGLSHYLVKEALSNIGSLPIYATSRADNDAMHKILNKYDFAQCGEVYDSNDKKRALVLFTRKIMEG